MSVQRYLKEINFDGLLVSPAMKSDGEGMWCKISDVESEIARITAEQVQPWLDKPDKPGYWWLWSDGKLTIELAQAWPTKDSLSYPSRSGKWQFIHQPSLPSDSVESR